MDGAKFDDLTRSLLVLIFRRRALAATGADLGSLLGATPSRRAALRGLAGLTAGTVLAPWINSPSSEAKKKKKKKKKEEALPREPRWDMPQMCTGRSVLLHQRLRDRPSLLQFRSAGSLHLLRLRP